MYAPFDLRFAAIVFPESAYLNLFTPCSRNLRHYIFSNNAARGSWLFSLANSRMISRLRSSASVGTCTSTVTIRSEEHTSELQSLRHLVCRLLLEKKIRD